MQDYSDITKNLSTMSKHINAYKKVFDTFITNIKAFNGSVPGVQELSISIDDKVITIGFSSYSFEVSYKYKLKKTISIGLINIYSIDEENEKELVHTEEFESNGKVIGSSLSMHDDVESMAILLNMVERAIKS